MLASVGRRLVRPWTAMAASSILPTTLNIKTTQQTQQQQRRGLAKWSIETELHHVYKDPAKIVDEALINRLLESTKEQVRRSQPISQPTQPYPPTHPPHPNTKAKDPVRIKAILSAAQDRARLRTPHAVSPDPPVSEFVQGLTLEEAATLLNMDASDKDMMQLLYNAALDVKRQIYGNRIVLFAPVYLGNYCVNSCQYCAFRGANKQMQRSMLTMEELKQEVRA